MVDRTVQLTMPSRTKTLDGLVVRRLLLSEILSSKSKLKRLPIGDRGEKRPFSATGENADSCFL